MINLTAIDPIAINLTAGLGTPTETSQRPVWSAARFAPGARRLFLAATSILLIALTSPIARTAASNEIGSDGPSLTAPVAVEPSMPLPAPAASEPTVAAPDSRTPRFLPPNVSTPVQVESAPAVSTPPAPPAAGSAPEIVPSMPGLSAVGPQQMGPPPTPVPMYAAPVGAPLPCENEYWIASSWRCRQTAPHGCACGDLDFYHVGGGGPAQNLNRDAFTASLAPGVPVCIVVHGSFTNWQGLCDDCAPVLRWIHCGAPQRPLHVLFYSWPSQGGITYAPHLDVAILGVRASFNSVYLAELIARIPPGHPVCLIGHSHGARMVAAALHLLGGGEVDNVRLTYPAPPYLRVRGVMIAAALDHHWLDPGQRFEMALCRTECLLVMRNDHDIVLTFYPWRKPFSKRALGERGLSNRDARRLGPLTSKVAILDVTRVVQSGHMWQHYYSRPELAAAIEPYVYFESGQAAQVMPPAPALTDMRSPAVTDTRSFEPATN